MHVAGAGTKETFYYTALDNLLDGIGQTLKLRVRCVMQLKSLGAGNPDGGLFTADQFDRKTCAPKNVAAPARGVVEVKALARRLPSPPRARRSRSTGIGAAWCWLPTYAIGRHPLFTTLFALLIGWRQP